MKALTKDEKKKIDVGFCQEGMCHCDFLGKDCVTITKQHAYSLSEMVKWFKELIAQGNIPDAPSRSDELTIGYCDELLGDLNQ